MFTNTRSAPKNAIALIFDLEGFSRFFNQPDVSDYLPTFLNYVFDAVQVAIGEGQAYWTPEDSSCDQLPLRVVQTKFMGDGALVIMLPADGHAHFAANAIKTLCNRLWNIKRNFSKILEKCSDEVPVFDVPTRIRFGVARGTVFELQARDGSTEYVGFCINLASRLQKYCPEFGFIASARLGIAKTMLEQNGYRKIVATGIKGFPKEIVFVDSTELNDLSKDRFAELFENLPGNE